jgi:hypothetical protein
MAGTIATLLSGAVTIPKTGTDLRAQNRHAYDELKAIQAVNDPALASPYLKASAASSIAATGGSTGNFTVTLNFPLSGVAVTTANIAYDADAATIQTAIDTAMSGETVIASYNAGDVDAAVTGNVSANAATITANGTTVNGAHMVVTTANVDMDVDAPAVTSVTVGTQNRPAEALLAALSVVTPASTPTPQGLTPSTGDYELGDNPLSLSPGLQDLIVREITESENAVLGNFLRDEVIGCV